MARRSLLSAVLVGALSCALSVAGVGPGARPASAAPVQHASHHRPAMNGDALVSPAPAQAASRGRPTDGDGPRPGADPTGGISYGPGTLNYYGGRVLHTYQTYAVFWDPGHQLDSSYTSTITQFLQDVAHDSGSTTSPYSVLTQYGDHDGPIQNRSTFAGSLVDTDPFPASGCTAAPTCVTDAQVRAELDSVLTAQGVARPVNRIFYLLTPPGVVDCFDSGAVSCSSNVYCAYHSDFRTTDGETLYADMPDEAGMPGCDDGNRPNGSSADAILTALSHETRESQDDPDGAEASGAAWQNPSYGESSDACYQTFTDVQGPAGAQYNTTINGHHYYLQDEWSNIAYAATGNGCVRSNSDTGPTPAFSDSVSGPTVSFDGTASVDPDPGDSIARFVWDFGDGSTGSGPSPQHFYASPGSHAVQLTVADQSGAFMWVEHDVVSLSPCTVPHAILGTSHADHLVGTSGDDILCGLGGNDTIDGRGGNDVILGGDGNDKLTGGAGNDQLVGGNGDDQLLGGDGNDNLVGGDGTDAFNAGAGNDVIDSTDRTDSVADSGDVTAETVHCGSGSDDLRFDPYDVLQCAAPHSLACATVTGGPATPAVVVPSGTTCLLSHAVVHGSATAQSGGELDMGYSKVASITDRGLVNSYASEISGDADAVGGVLQMDCGRIGGNVAVRQGPQDQYTYLENVGCDEAFSVGGSVTMTDDPTGISLINLSIGGSIKASHIGSGGGRFDFLAIEQSTVAGSVTVVDDGPATTDIAGNTVQGDLVCRRNAPAPEHVLIDFDGAAAANTVAGRRVGQTCADPSF